MINLCLNVSLLNFLKCILGISTLKHDGVNEKIGSGFKRSDDIRVVGNDTLGKVITSSIAQELLTSDILFIYWHKFFSHMIDFILNVLCFS